MYKKNQISNVLWFSWLMTATTAQFTAPSKMLICPALNQKTAQTAIVTACKTVIKY